MISNFFIKPKDKNYPCGDESGERNIVVRKHGFTTHFSNPLQQNKILIGKATILWNADE